MIYLRNGVYFDLVRNFKCLVKGYLPMAMSNAPNSPSTASDRAEIRPFPVAYIVLKMF